MKFMLIVHHDEAAFNQLSEATKRDMLAESVQLTHELQPAILARLATPTDIHGHGRSSAQRQKLRN